VLKEPKEPKELKELKELREPKEHLELRVPQETLVEKLMNITS
jgi:hypothetical protein